MAIVVNGLNMSPTNGVSLWLYDTVTGLNVVSKGPPDFSISDFSPKDFAVGYVEYENLSQKP